MMYYFVVILSVFLSSVAQMMLKKGALKQHDSFIKEYLNFWVIGGYSLLGLSLLMNIFAISRGIQVKEVGSMEALSYLFVPVLSCICFKEGFTVKKIGAILTILVGVFVFFK